MSLKVTSVSPAHMSVRGGCSCEHTRDTCMCLSGFLRGVCVCISSHVSVCHHRNIVSPVPHPGVGSLCHQLLGWPGRCLSAQYPQGKGDAMWALSPFPVFLSPCRIPPGSTESPTEGRTRGPQAVPATCKHRAGTRTPGSSFCPSQGFPGSTRVWQVGAAQRCRRREWAKSTPQLLPP